MYALVCLKKAYSYLPLLSTGKLEIVHVRYLSLVCGNSCGLWVLVYSLMSIVFFSIAYYRCL